MYIINYRKEIDLHITKYKRIYAHFNKFFYMYHFIIDSYIFLLFHH